MPLIGLRPTKARLVMEDNRDSVLVHEGRARRRRGDRAVDRRRAQGPGRRPAHSRAQEQRQRRHRLRRLRRIGRRSANVAREVPGQRRHVAGQVRDAAARRQRGPPACEVHRRGRRAQGRRCEGARLPDALGRAHQGVGQPRLSRAAGHQLRDDPADGPGDDDHGRDRSRILPRRRRLRPTRRSRS